MTSSALYFGGSILLFIGERLIAEGSLHWALSGAGLLGMLGGMALSLIRSSSTRDPVRARGHRAAGIGYAAGLLAVLIYGLSTPGMVGMLGLNEEAARRWTVSLSALWPILWLAGSAPSALITRVLLDHPERVPNGAIRHAFHSGLIGALGLSLLFPVNYLASAHKLEWDVAYFRVTDPGEATLSLVSTLGEPVDAYLFYPPGNEVKERVLPYFEQLEAASSDLFRVHVVDQPMAPDLAEEFAIRTNGHVVFQQADGHRKFRLPDDIDRARRDLKKLDSLVQKNLLKLSRDARTVYMMTGHGEASHRTRDTLLLKLNTFKTLLEDQNLKVREFGLADGSSNTVPEDAAMLVVPAPENPLLPEELRTVRDYLERGGSLWVLVEPGRDPAEELLSSLGLSATEPMLANASVHLRQTRGIADRVLLLSNRFGTHAAVSTLSKHSTQLFTLVPTSVALEEGDQIAGKRTPIVRSFPETWMDVDGDRKQARDGSEPGDVHTIAWAIEGSGGSEEEPAFRAIAMGDVNAISDAIIGLNPGNKQLVLDMSRWLTRDEDVSGEVNSEEDVKIAHTREQDQLWFYGTVFAVPLLVLLGGVGFTRIRRRGK